MGTIIVKWTSVSVKDSGTGYNKVMRVIKSDHKKFKKNTRFDFGYFRTATNEGYTIISLPEDEL